MVGYFTVWSNEEGNDIKFNLHSTRAKEKVPAIQQDLYVEVEKANVIIKNLNRTDSSIKKEYFQALLSLAQAGLVGETSQPELAMKSLIELKKEIVLREGQRIKNNYMNELGINAIILSVIAIVLNYVLRSFYKSNVLNMYLWVWIGAMTGTWISFAARTSLIKFEQLSILEEDMIGPRLRLIYIGLCSIVLVLLLNSNIISVKIGATSTEKLINNKELQFIIGVLCGLVESKLGINMYEKASKIIKVN